MLFEALRLLRVFHKMPQADLAEILGISRSYLSEVESGKKKVSLELLEKYGKAFDVPPSSLLLFSEQMSNDGFGEKTRVYAADKVLKFFRWIEDGGSVERHAGS